MSDEEGRKRLSICMFKFRITKPVTSFDSEARIEEVTIIANHARLSTGTAEVEILIRLETCVTKRWENFPLQM